MSDEAVFDGQVGADPGSGAQPPRPVAPRGERLAAGSELLLRNVHPAWLDSGRLTSQAFTPFPKDVGLLSTDRGACTTPEASYDLHVNSKSLRSEGIWAVTASEADGEGVASFADPDDGPPPNPAHAVIDFRGLTRRECSAIAKRLAAHAATRKRLFPR